MYAIRSYYGLTVFDREKAIAADVPVTDERRHVSPRERTVHDLAAGVAHDPRIRHGPGPRLEIPVRVDRAQDQAIGIDERVFQERSAGLCEATILQQELDSV